jgi:hypothetical protein
VDNFVPISQYIPRYLLSAVRAVNETPAYRSPHVGSRPEAGQAGFAITQNDIWSGTSYLVNPDLVPT